MTFLIGTKCDNNSRSWKFGSGNILKSINVKNVALPIDKVNKVCYINGGDIFLPHLK